MHTAFVSLATRQSWSIKSQAHISPKVLAVSLGTTHCSTSRGPFLLQSFPNKTNSGNHSLNKGNTKQNAAPLIRIRRELLPATSLTRRRGGPDKREHLPGHADCPVHDMCRFGTS